MRGLLGIGVLLLAFTGSTDALRSVSTTLRLPAWHQRCAVSRMDTLMSTRIEELKARRKELE